MKDEVRVTGCRLAVRFYLDSKVAPYREGVLKVRMREARRLVDRSSRVHDGPLGSNCSMSEEGALFRITVGNRDYHHLSLTGAGSVIVREPCGFAFVFAYLLVLGLSLRDSDTANQSQTNSNKHKHFSQDHPQHFRLPRSQRHSNPDFMGAPCNRERH